MYGIKGHWVASAPTWEKAHSLAKTLSFMDPIHAYAIEEVTPELTSIKVSEVPA